MPYADTPSFTPRAAAQREFGRSKSSFIRDVEDAFVRHDTKFLAHFRVLLNDGSSIEGPQATKDALRKVQSKQPRWFVETTFLETRYWEKGDREEPSEKGSRTSGETGTTRLHGKALSANTPSEFRLQHDLTLAQQRIAAQGDAIGRLEKDKEFLQAELENRRGEIDKLRGFFESVGGAADSAAKLREGGTEKSSDSEVIEGTPVRDSAKADQEKGSKVERFFPTFHRAYTRFRSI